VGVFFENYYKKTIEIENATIHYNLKNDLVEHLWCRNPTLAKCGGEAQHLEKLEIWSPPGLPNV